MIRELGWIDLYFLLYAMRWTVGLTLIGLGAGQVHASRDLRTTDVELKSRYIQSVDPYAKLPLQ